MEQGELDHEIAQLQVLRRARNGQRHGEVVGLELLELGPSEVRYAVGVRLVAT